MKVGILTFHNAINYGAILQAYATQQLLSSMGYDAEIIDYHNTFIDKFYAKYQLNINKLLTLNVFAFIKSIIVSISYYRRLKRYCLFYSNIKLSGKQYNLGDRIDGYDIIMIGSDQVWNTRLTHGFDDMYWGAFQVPRGTRKIAWAVSMGDADTTGKKEEIALRLKYFDKISVRENSLKLFLNSLTDQKIYVTVDPTMLIKDVWTPLCKPVKESGYILVYAVKDLPITMTVARRIANEFHKKIIVINAYPYKSRGNGVKQSCGPQDFLSYINHASMVVTSSFHGTVFSILFKKVFFSVIPDNKSNERISDLLISLGLEDRIVNENKDIHLLNSIDYNYVDKKMSQLREYTLSFLIQSMNI